MSINDIIQSSRIIRIRELTAQVERLRAENTRLKNDLESLERHLELAMLASRDLETLKRIDSDNAKLIIVDGWNLILGSDKVASNPDELIRQAKSELQSRKDTLIWIIFDGNSQNTRIEGNLRIFWTGGSGKQRADRFICDYLRMCKHSGDLSRIEIRTFDKALLKTIEKIRSGN